MPKLGYKATIEHKKNMSEAQKRVGNRPPIFRMEKSSNWKGGKIMRGNYIYIKVSGHPFVGKQGYIAEHRLVMEKHLGRFLDKKEVVHHVDEDTTNNHISNLRLFNSAGQHTKESHAEIYERQKVDFKGKHFSPNTEFKKGVSPWNKKR